MERESVNSSEKPGYERKLIFWWKKVDFIKTPVDKVYMAFGGKIDVCTDTRIYIRESTFYQEIVDLIEKSGYVG